MKHTPGPWEAWGNGNAKYSVTGLSAAAALVAERELIKDPFYKGLYVHMASASKVCPAMAFGNTPTEAKANGMLIAAAPELLEALQIIRDSTAVLNHLDPSTQQFICDTIKKATGE